LSNKKTAKILNHKFPDFKGVNSFLLSGIFVVIGVFFASASLHAQVSDELYSSANNDTSGVSTLMSAVADNDVDGVRFFSKAGSALVNQKNFGGATALHMACRENNFEIAKILIENGADINAVDNEGWTPLMRAALSGNKEIIDLLLSKNAQASNVNADGESAIIHATTSDCADCLNSLFSKFNFIKLMDVQLLKGQLSSAFVIAQNRDNQVTQGIIESYLDRAIKTSPPVVKNESGNENFAAPIPAAIVQNKNPAPVVQTKVTPTVQAKQAPVIQPKPTPIVQTKVFNIISADPPKQPEPIQVKTVVVTKPVMQEKPVVTNVVTKVVKPQESEVQKPQQTQVYKLLYDCDCDYKTEKPSQKPFYSDEKKNDQDVILLVKKPSSSGAILTTKSGNSVFKFEQGPAGKIVKRKPKPQVLAPVAPVPTVAATAPIPAVPAVQKKPATPVNVPVSNVKPVTPVSPPTQLPVAKLPTVAPSKAEVPKAAKAPQAPAPAPKNNMDKSVIIDLSNPK